MFKASLIEDNQYYELKKRLSILGILSLIVLQIISHFFVVTTFQFALYLCLVVLIFYYVWLTQREMKQVTSDKKLEINNQSILIKGKSNELLEEIIDYSLYHKKDIVSNTNSYFNLILSNSIEILKIINE